jgi:eukaryotic-like serine/threonine-protein kinase
LLFGRYTPIRRLRSGGTGDVFLASQEGYIGTRYAAIRRIRPDLARDPEFVELFRSQAVVAGRLAHPNIAQVWDIGSHGDDLYVVSQHIQGRTVHEVLRGAAQLGLEIPIEVIMAVALDVAAGLHHAHELADDRGLPLGVVHRDLSPRNVLIGADGETRILDFGIAAISVAFDERAGERLGGQPGYASPEQARFEPIDHRSDIYSLGIMLWEMTAGQRLYPVADALQALQTIGHRPIPSVAGLRPLPPGWEGVLRRALAASPGERYGSARALHRDVEDVARAAGHSVSSQPVVGFMAELFPELGIAPGGSRIALPRVLVVDDEPDMLELIARALQGAAEVHSAGSVAEALAAVAAERFDLVLTDERMPDEPGMELLARIARDSPGTARVMMSAYADAELMVAAINRGRVDRFLMKPFMPDELRSLIADALAFAPRAAPRATADASEPRPPSDPPGASATPPPARPNRSATADAEPATADAEPATADAASATPDAVPAEASGAITSVTGTGTLDRAIGPPPVALPWESLRSLTEAVREDALSCALLVGVADQPIGGDDQAALQWVLERRVPQCWMHAEDRAVVVLVPGIAPGFAASLAAEMRDAAFGVLGARLAVAVAELPAGEDLASAGRTVERAAVQAWREEGGLGP